MQIFNRDSCECLRHHAANRTWFSRQNSEGVAAMEVVDGLFKDAGCCTLLQVDWISKVE